MRGVNAAVLDWSVGPAPRRPSADAVWLGVEAAAQHDCPTRARLLCEAATWP